MRSFVLAALAVLTALLLACACSRDVESREPDGSPQKGKQTAVTAKPTPCFEMLLSDGNESSEKAVQNKTVTGTPLSAEETSALMKRMPPFSEKGEVKEFARRAESLPAPRTGAVKKEAWPPATELARPDAETVKDNSAPTVLRFSPEGNVDIAPQVSVTFSKPMIALASQDEASEQVPVKLEPQPEGKWRWLGTKTCIFDAEGRRMPMSTKYKAVIPKGTKAADGTAIEQDVAFGFNTPELRFHERFPQGGSQPLDPLIGMVFNQDINASDVLPFIAINVKGGRDIGFRQATREEASENSTIKHFMDKGLEKRCLVLKCTEELPKNSTIWVILKEGAPSAEGPMTTVADKSYTFSTYAPLEIVDHGCGWGRELPPPGMPMWIRFNNSLDEENFDESKLIKVSPEVEGLKVTCSGNTINIGGRTKGRTEYTVTVSENVTDRFGQTLGKNQSFRFKFGSAEPYVQSVGKQMIIADPASKPCYSIFSINTPSLPVKLYQVTPSDWEAWCRWNREYGYEDKPPRMPGKKVFDKKIAIKSAQDEFVETRIPLEPALTNGLGQVIVVVEVEQKKEHFWSRRSFRPIAAWIQVTNIGLDAFASPDSLAVMAASLKDGSPLEGLSLTAEGQKAVTGKDGLATFKSSGDHSGPIVIAEKDGDIAFLPSGPISDSWSSLQEKDSLRWFAFSDRGIYKPKEKAYIKGFVRKASKGVKGDIEAIVPAAESVAWNIVDPRGNTIASGEASLSRFGGFDFTADIPDNANLGTARVNLSLTPSNAVAGFNNRTTSVSIEIQEFRRPEFEVSTKGDGESFIGESATVTATGNYYAGGGLPGAEVEWTVTSHTSSYSPPGWEGFTFGTWRPWWHCWMFDEDLPEEKVEHFSSTTDSAGKHTLKLDYIKVYPPAPVSVKASAAITDVNRQAWASSSSMLVHPSALYVGIKPLKTFVEKKQPIVCDFIAADVSGKAADGVRVNIKSARLDWEYKNGKTREKELDVEESSFTSGTSPKNIKFNPKNGGTYRISAEIADSKGRFNKSEVIVWVAGGTVPVSRNAEEQEVTLVPDKKEYKPGETASIMVQSPFVPADGVMLVCRSGIVAKEHFHMTEPTYTLKVPIASENIPNLSVQVYLNGADFRSNADGTPNTKVPKRPAYAKGTISLKIPPYERALAVKPVPREQGLEPGGSTKVDIYVTDNKGNPVTDCEVAVIAADEAVLALVNHKIGDPLDLFYMSRSAFVNSYRVRQYLQLAELAELQGQQASRQEMNMVEDAVCYEAAAPGAAAGGRGMMGMAMNSAAAPKMMFKASKSMEAKSVERSSDSGTAKEAQTPIAVRSNFNPLALFMAEAHTNAQGVASVDLKLPDNLTRYRITAVAVDPAKKFGKGESSVLARLPLMVRPSAPRFLNFGDKFELPVVLQNQTSSPMDVKVAARASNLDVEKTGRLVTVPANDRVEVRFPASALEVGSAVVQIGAASGAYADASEVKMPVWTPCTTEAFATYGQIDKGAASQPVVQPRDVWPQFGGLEITTSSTALQELTDAVIYLREYPYDCAEQVSSRVMALCALKDVLTSFKAEGLPSEKDMQKSMEADIARLHRLQDYSGGFGLWKRGKDILPFVSIHAANAIYMARAKGYEVPDEMFKRSQRYLENIESHIPHWYSESSKRSIRAYAVDVLRSIGKPNPEKAQKLYAECGVKGLGLDDLGWLLPTLHEAGCTKQVSEIRTYLNNNVSETAGAACFNTSYSDEAYLLMSSNRRTDGILLRALITVDPKNDLIPKLVRGLLNHRTKGRWGSTQENVFILMALDRYFNVYENIEPDFVARMWLGDNYAGEHKYKGRSADYHETFVPMKDLSTTGSDLLISKEGQGRLYYRLGLKYAPKSLDIKAADYGFTVQRKYEAIDNPDDVKRMPDGTWKVKAGANVRCTVTMVAPSRRYHVALVDPMPAGFEAINPVLAVSEEITPKKNDDNDNESGMNRHFYWWQRQWYCHDNLRDERAEAFATLLWEGVYEYTYNAKATTPGTFVVPPAKAEEMYSPEVFGRSDSAKVVVE